MGSIFRSEKMSLVQMYLQPEAAYQTTSRLGEAGCVQFIDMNSGVSASSRKFVSEVRRCEEIERKIRFIKSEVEKDGIKVSSSMEDLPCAPNPKEIIDLEIQLEKTETELVELAANYVNLQTNYLELIELISVLEKSDDFFYEQESHNFDASAQNRIRNDVENRSKLGFVAGVILRQREYAFERMLWRISRGNVLVRRCDLDGPVKDPKTGISEYKSIFVVFFQGDQLQTRIRKVCSGFHASMYPCSSSHEERHDMLSGARTRLEDLKVILDQTQDHRRCVLTAVSKQLENWNVMAIKIKAIYYTLNMFNVDVSGKCMIGEGWVPKKQLNLVENALCEGSAAVGSTVPSFLNILDTKKVPPTYYNTNKFTRGFQNLIDAYGIASYREVNPGLYTCITFPFLFAVMFGDMGHGFILFLLGFWMVIDEKRLSKRKGGEIWNIFFTGRYIILLMGLFAVYTGFHYNDIFSKSINVFGSYWRIDYNRTTVLTNPTLQLNPSTATVGVYPMGLDPVWQSASNKIIFLNTYKMKLSIIFGVLHMVFGVCLSVENFVYFKNYALIFLQFLPQVIFLLLMFGYMVFMMFYKWVQYSPTTDILVDSPGCAPSVLIMFINMILFKENTASAGCNMYMFSSQHMIQVVFILVALLCIPWMLLGKPLYIKFKRVSKSKKENHGEIIEVIEQITENNVKVTVTDVSEEVGQSHDDEPMSEVWIHQAIHTVEYVLSTISHTASYLRLWALSLAHAQLSEVLWTMVLSKSFQFSGFSGSIAVFLIFAVWEFFTISIMVMMEGLSAFLHTLRLHWVEFMSKFFEGAGIAFEPFSFKRVISKEEEEQ